MMKKIKKQVLACRLEIHWWLIMWYRKRMTKLFSCGEPLSSPRMLQLNNKAGRHHVFIKLTSSTSTRRSDDAIIRILNASP